MSAVADIIYQAQTGLYEIPRVTETQEHFSEEQAYVYQEELVRRYASEGRQIVGYKMGMTSFKKMKQAGIERPIRGALFEDMYLRDLKIQFDRLIHPKAEPEIAVRFAKDVPHSVTSESLKNYIGEIAPAIEIVDSRFEKSSFSLPDAVADNCSAAQFAIGTWVPYDPRTIAIDNIHCKFFVNGEQFSKGYSFDVLGSPLYAIYDLQRALVAKDVYLKAGDIVMTGAMTEAANIKAGDVIVNRTDILGEVSIQ